MPKISWRKPDSSRSLEIFVAIAQAAKLGYSKSYIDTSTNHIADLAGVSVASLYRYFENKESILAYLIEEFITGTREHFKILTIANEGHEYAQFILNILEGAFERYRENISFLKVMYQHGGEIGWTERIFQVRIEIAEDLANVIHQRYQPNINREKLKECLLLAMNSYMGILQAQALSQSGMPEKFMLEKIVNAIVYSQ